MAAEPDAGRLLVRLAPGHGESARGYVARLAEQNGYPNGSWMLRWLVPGRNPRARLDRLAAAADLAVETLLECDGIQQVAGGYRLVLNGGVLNRETWRLSSRRYCPHCLAEDGIWRGLWEVSLITACPIHGVELRDACPHCGKPLIWSRDRYLRCRCGASLLAVDSLPATATEIATAELIAGLFHSHASILQGKLAEMPAAERVRLLWFLGSYLHQPDKPHPRKLSHAGGIVECRATARAAGEIALHWPDAFESLLTLLAGGALGDSSLKRTWGGFYRALYRDFDAPCFNFLHQAFETYLGTQWPWTLNRRNRRLNRDVVMKHGVISFSEATRALHVRRDTLIALERAGTLRVSRRRVSKARLGYGVRREELNKVRNNRPLTGREVAAGLGLSKRRLKEVLSSQVIQDISGAHLSPADAITHHDLENFITRLRCSLSPRATVNQDETTLSAAMRRSLALGGLVELLQAIQSMDVMPRGYLSGVPPLPGLVFGKRELNEWLETRKHREGNSISIMEAAKRLCVKQEVAYALVREGILETVNDEGRKRDRRVSPAGMKLFRERYVFLREVAAQAGCSPRAMLASLRAQGVIPVTGPVLGGCRQYLFERAHLGSINVRRSAAESSCP